MMFDQTWLSQLMDLQKKATEMAKNKNSVDEIQGLVKNILNQWGIPGFPWETNFQTSGESPKEENYQSQNNFHFNIDISEKKQCVQIQFLVPGIVDPNDLEIKLSGNTLDISGKSTHIIENDGSFSRKILLPAEVTSTGASAVYKDLYLTITLPKIPPEGQVIPFDFYPSSQE